MLPQKEFRLTINLLHIEYMSNLAELLRRIALDIEAPVAQETLAEKNDYFYTIEGDSITGYVEIHTMGER